MHTRKWIYLLLILPLLVSALSLGPAQAARSNQADKTVLVIWCPADVSVPIPSENGCSEAFLKMGDLLTVLATKNPATAGNIWIGKNYNSYTAGDGDVLFDGATLTKMAKHALNFKGGWDGSGESTLDPNTPSIFDGASLNIQNWKGNVSLRNLLVGNASSSAASCPGAVCVKTTGNIQLNQVQANKNPGPPNDLLNGAWLDSFPSAGSPPGSVTVINSQFSDNKGEGLVVATKGAVKLKTVAASRNLQGSGINIRNNYDTAASPVTVTDGQFNENITLGLYIISNGIVTLADIYAEGNQLGGAVVNNTDGSGDVLLRNSNIFLQNGFHSNVSLGGGIGSGLVVYSKGNVTAQHLIGDQNNTYGVVIDNTAASAPKTISITGSGEFKGNGGHGLGVYSLSDVSLAGVHADLNPGAGITVAARGKVTVTCSGAFANNVGLYVRGTAGESSQAAGLTLRGFFSYSNAVDEDILTAAPVVYLDSDCPSNAGKTKTSTPLPTPGSATPTSFPGTPDSSPTAWTPPSSPTPSVGSPTSAVSPTPWTVSPTAWTTPSSPTPAVGSPTPWTSTPTP